MLIKLTLNTLLAAALVAVAAFAWQARNDGVAGTAAGLARVVGFETGFGSDDGGDAP